MTDHNDNSDVQKISSLTLYRTGIEMVDVDHFKSRIDGMEQWDLEWQLGKLIEHFHVARGQVESHEKSASDHEEQARGWRGVEAALLEEIRICRQRLGLKHGPIEIRDVSASRGNQ